MTTTTTTTTTATAITRVAVSFGGETVTVDAADMWKAGEELQKKHPNAPGYPSMKPVDEQERIGAYTREEPKTAPVSSWSNPVVDETARARIEAQHETLKRAGIEVDASEQLYATGTRMADVGYANQHARHAEHLAKLPLSECASKLVAVVNAEQRREQVVTASEIARSIHANGKVTVLGGYHLKEQAIRGLTARAGSPCLTYLLGIRDRIVARTQKMLERDEHGALVRPEEVRRALYAESTSDRQEIARVLRYELDRAGDVKFMLRLRDAEHRRDVFAAVSPGYAVADAPQVFAETRLFDSLPADTRGTWSYDAERAAWEVRASVWTPTPVDEQAVGEPFEGYAVFSGRDNGTGGIRGGGGCTMLRCLNASTYYASTKSVVRRHLGRPLVKIDEVIEGASEAITALCRAWGVARSQEVALPVVDEKPLTLEEALPGYFRSLLTDRRSEMAVLPGRTERNVRQLSELFGDERRDHGRLVRADFAQAVTRYAQDFEVGARREIEAGAGAWLVAGRPVGYVPAD